MKVKLILLGVAITITVLAVAALIKKQHKEDTRASVYVPPSHYAVLSRLRGNYSIVTSPPANAYVVPKPLVRRYCNNCSLEVAFSDRIASVAVIEAKADPLTMFALIKAKLGRTPRVDPMALELLVPDPEEVVESGLAVPTDRGMDVGWESFLNLTTSTYTVFRRVDFVVASPSGDLTRAIVRAIRGGEGG